MSLFDDDDESLSSASSEHQPVQNPSPVGQQKNATNKPPDGDDADAFLNLLSAKKHSAFDDSVKLTNTSNVTTVRVGGGTSHFRRVAGGQPPLPPTGASTTAEKSVFGNSIAAALQLRKETQQELVWQRLERERAAEQNDPSIIEKDLEVAPFVTPAYQHALRQRRLQKKGEVQGNHQGGDAREDEDDDPLEKYLQTLMEETEQTHAAQAATLRSSPTPAQGDYYERQMHATLAKEKEGRRQQEEAQRVQDEEEEPTTSSAVPTPAVSMEELQQLVSAPAEANKGASMTGEGQPPQSALPGDQASQSAAAVEAHNKALFVAREARKRRRADAAFVESCAARCNERMYKCFRVF